MSKSYRFTSDEPELEFSSYEAELWRFQTKPSQAELGHFDFRAETELKPSWQFQQKINFPNFAPITWF